ncbi:MAG: hypothetical protein Q8Q09_10285 [Deltaproteobacteria bacterium]|nr:hypothetical protein [Deltaproteobacteria bacterium]
MSCCSACAREVEFIVVGGVCAVLHGAPVATFDLDIVHSRTPENVAKRLDVLGGIDAMFRADSRELRPTAALLEGPGHLLLRTTLGALGCSGGDRAGF